MPRLNGKFVSREKYESAMASDEATQISTDNAVTIDPPDVSAVHPVTAAFIDVANIITEETPVSEETATATRKPRTVDPITAATAVVRKAKKELDRSVAYWSKTTRTAPASIDDAQAAYDKAVVALQDALNV